MNRRQRKHADLANKSTSDSTITQINVSQNNNKHTTHIAEGENKNR